MLKSKDVFEMENKLLNSMNPAFFDIENFEETEDDRQIYKALSAVQGLRLYLEKKEDKPC